MTSIALDVFSLPGFTRRLVSRIFHTDASLPGTVLRLILALVFFPHGAQKLFGWFGGYGFEGTMSYFQSLGIPYPFGLLAIAAETLGPLALLLGFGTRIAAFGIATNMMVAALTVHLHYGFFANWFGTQKGEGVEYHILAITLTSLLMLFGGGRFSVDRRISESLDVAR